MILGEEDDAAGDRPEPLDVVNTKHKRTLNSRQGKVVRTRKLLVEYSQFSRNYLSEDGDGGGAAHSTGGCQCTTTAGTLRATLVERPSLERHSYSG